MKLIACSTLAVALAVTSGCKKSEEEKPEVKPETKPATEPEPEPKPAEYTVVEPDGLDYQPLDPKNPDGPKMAVVFGDPMSDGVAAFFLTIPAGGDAGVHSHSAAYQAVVVSGTRKHWLPGDEKVEPLGPGSYVRQPGGQPHGDICTGDSECVLFMIMEGKFDFTPTPDVKEVKDRGDYKQVAAGDARLAPMDPEGAGPKMAVLSGDLKSGPVAFQIERPAKSEAGMHKHTSGYHALVLEGPVGHWAEGGDGADKELVAGSYWFQPGEQFHNDACRGDEPCRVFVFMPGAMDVTPKEAE